MKVAVTGATGFVGRHIVPALQGLGHSVVASGRTPRAAASVEGTFVPWELGRSGSGSEAYEAFGRPDVVVHLAWGGLPNYGSLHHFEQELPLHYHFLKGMVEAGLCRIVCAGTCFEYGMRDGPLHEGLEDAPANAYALAKSALRRQLQCLQAVRPFAFTWARLFYMWGSGQPGTSLYPQLCQALETGQSEFAMSPGDQLRDYLPVEEVACHLATLARLEHGAGVVNVCSGQPVSVRAMVERWIEERHGKVRLALGKFPYSKHEPRAFWGSREKLDALISRI